MYDRIIEGYLKDFIDAEGLGKIEISKAFEHFINHCVIARDYTEPFDCESINVGGTGDYGIDGVAILVNEHLVDSVEDIDFFKNRLRRLDVRFIFIQSKTSNSFTAAEIGTFLFGVRAFFSPSISGIENERLKYLRQLKERIYDSSIDMNSAPACELYYATTGKWDADATVKHRIDSEIDLLKQTNLFSDVIFTPLDGEAIKRIYRELKHKVVKEIVFDKHTILPNIPNIAEAYIGVIPAKAYLSLITDTEGRLQRTLFYDNVRDYQGNNPVNQDITRTLHHHNQRDKFVVLNNGITIVAHSLTKVGSTFKLRDFQIVNGCQTSHVLYANRSSADGVFIPIKLIVTSDPEVTNLIIKGTNRQTEVLMEAFESLSPFHKELEEFYSTVGKDKAYRLYYERRSKQFDQLPIRKSQIITLTAQLKSFLAMFLSEPHSTHRYYGELLNRNRTRIFHASHSTYPYYVSGYALYVLDQLFASGELDQRYKRFKFQLLLVFRILAEQMEVPYLNEKKLMDKYCGGLLDVLSAPERVKKHYSAAVRVLDETLGRRKYAEPERLRAFTTDLVERANAGTKTTRAAMHRQRGTVKWFSSIKGYGFILCDNPKVDVFVHYSQVEGFGYPGLTPGERVELTVSEGTKGLEAEDVVILKAATS